MSDKIKNVIVSCVFLLFIFGFAAMCVICYYNPDDFSESERKELAQFPSEITWQGIIDKTVIDKFEDYSVDQFPFREFFRNIKANFQMNVLMLKENNGIALEDGYFAQINQSFGDKAVEYSIGRLQYVYDKYIKDINANKYVSIIPDKNYFLGEKYGYVTPDYEGIVNMTTSALDGMEYIDIFGALELEDYYLTDTHWKQEEIFGVVETLGNAMDFEVSGKYTEKLASDAFKGVYYGHSALKPDDEKIIYLTNEVINSLKVYNYATQKYCDVYDFTKIGGMDEYEFFLSGTTPMIRIENPNADTNKELVLFRDSYGSSIAPMIAEGYKTVYVVDIRHVHPDAVPQMINLEGKDILFLYSTLVLNSVSFK